MTSDLELIKNFHLLDGKEIVIWGAGNNGKAAHKKVEQIMKDSGHSKYIRVFCDSDSRKWNTDIISKGKIINPEALSELVKEKEILVLIASDYVNEIVKQIEALGIMEHSCVCTWFGFQMAVHFNIKDERINEEFRSAHLREWYFNDRIVQARYYYEKFVNEKEFLCLADACNDLPIYVIQPGKVGSTTIVNSLYHCGIPFVHSHRISFESDTMDEYKEVCDKAFEQMKKKKLKIITLVREPISRDISCFWQLIKREWILFSGIADKDFLRFYNRFLRYAYEDKHSLPDIPNYARGFLKWGDLREWFNDTIYRTFGLDVFAFPFDKKAGYTVIKKDNIEMLIIQLEKLSGLENIIGDFIGIEKFSLESANEAKSYGFYPTYKEFQEKVVLSKEYISQCYGSESYIQHFYSVEDQNKFLRKWENNIR